jgi:uncharacterized membrane protein YoaK (UPF0700 family)
MTDTQTSIRELHDDYAKQVNLAVAEGRDDLVDTLSTRFASARRGAPAAPGTTKASRASTASRAGGKDVSGERAHGPLPVLLVGLTVVTGLVDAFSYLSLGHVFVANMTGNVVFVGFGLAGAGGISLVASLVAVLAFALGAALGGRWSARQPPHRGRLLAVGAAAQTVLVVAAATLALVAGLTGSTTRLLLIVLLATAMGGQNAVARRLAVPDLTTTVLTLTVTGLVADTTTTKVRLRRLVPVLAMLGGAFAGGVLLRWVSPTAPLWTAALVLAATAIVVHRATGRPHAETWR